MKFKIITARFFVSEDNAEYARQSIANAVEIISNNDIPELSISNWGEAELTDGEKKIYDTARLEAEE